MNKIIKSILELIFPSNCFGCNKEGVWLCNECLSTVPLCTEDICYWCNKVDTNNICPNCQKDSLLSSLFVITAYENKIFQDMLHSLKYNFASDTIDAFELLISKYFNQINPDSFNKNSIIIPIPLHKKRFAERGFNQSELIGNIIAKKMHLAIDPKILTRTKNTKSQMTLKRNERISNMKDSFICQNPEQIDGKNIILIDDVLTTGTTIQEAASALKESNCRSVSAIVLAKGGFDPAK